MSELHTVNVRCHRYEGEIVSLAYEVVGMDPKTLNWDELVHLRDTLVSHFDRLGDPEASRLAASRSPLPLGYDDGWVVLFD